MDTDKKQIILDLLEDYPHGLSLTDIRRELKDKGLKSRLTVTKYVHELIGEKKVKIRKIGQVKLVYLPKYWKGDQS